MPDQMLGCSTVLDLLTIFPGYLGLSKILQKLSRESLHTAMAQHLCSALGMIFLRAVECSWAGVRKDASLKTFIFSILGWKSSQEWFTIQIVVKTYAWPFATNICIQTSKVSLGITYRNYSADTVSYHLLKEGHSSYLTKKCSSDFLIGILLPADLRCKESLSEVFVFRNIFIWVNLF